MLPDTNTSQMERYTIEIDGVAITTYHPQQAIALAKQIAGHKASAIQAAQPRSEVLAVATQRPSAVPRPQTGPLDVPTAPKRRGSAAHALTVGSYLLTMGQGQHSKKAIVEKTGLSDSNVNRGFVSLAEAADKRRWHPNEVYVRDQKGRDAFFMAGPRLGELLAEMGPAIDKEPEEPDEGPV